MKFIVAAVFFAQILLADDSVNTVYGERNHLDKFGNFKHPFLGQSSNVEFINYPDIGAFSMKLTE